MKHPEADYINLGARYERASPARVTALAQVIRTMLEKENPSERTYARELIEKGRSEARR